MLRVTLKNFWGHKRRLVGTSLAVILGIAFLSGTLVLSDTMRHSFATLFTQTTQGTDAVVRSSTKIQARGDNVRPPIDESLLAKVRAVPGVQKAIPRIQGLGQIVGRDGKTLGGNGPPTFAGNWLGDKDLDSYHLVAGRAPAADEEVVIDKRSADQGHLAVGSTTQVLTPEPVKVRVVGIAKFASLDNQGGVTFAGFTFHGAQKHVLKRTGKISEILVKGAGGIAQPDLVRRIHAALPTSTETITGKQLNQELQDNVGKAFLNAFTTFLTVFAGISLVVATFSIYNTFSILVAQRSRESALLRAVGASRAQILGSTLAETLAVGLISSLLGFLGGLGVATGLRALFSSFGAQLPGSGLTLKPSVLITSIVVGLLVTVVAGFFPALRAARIPPIAALRDIAIDRSASSRVRLVLGSVLTGAGLVLVITAVIGKGGSYLLQRVGLGAFLLLVGVIVLGPVMAKPAASVLGAPIARLRGITGRLARQNALRNPKRTAGTAAALMVGVAVVTLFTVFASSIKASVNHSVDRTFGGDLVVGPNTRFGPSQGISPKIAAEVSRLPQVSAAVGIGGGLAHVVDKDVFVSVADPLATSRVLNLDVRQGDLARLQPTGMAISKKLADDRSWTVGTKLPVTFPDGAKVTQTVQVIYKSADLAGDYMLPLQAWAPHAPQATDFAVLINLKKGVSIDAARPAVERISNRYPGTKVQDRKQFTDSFAQGINQTLILIYVMLALAVIIALMGIANTLSLSVYERTREIGLLRAVGETRRQTRSMVRWEAILIAVFGTVGGLGLGTFLGWSLVTANSNSSNGLTTFAAPVGGLAGILIVGGLVGVLAAIRPARRAAKLDILRAVAAE
ncbi:MAG: transporter substrate-binding protein [Acidimicrobiales bacterium]|nr:transporter substrate-binding protein [Acidimicrobiales bacterium]